MGRTNAKRGYVKRYISHNIKNNMLLMVLALLFVAGILAGAASLRFIGEDTAALLIAILNGSKVNAASYSGFAAIFASSFLSNIGILFVLFLCGFCAIGQPVIVLVPFLKGYGFGLVAGYYIANNLGSLSYLFLSAVPDVFFSIVVILLAANAALKLSVGIYRSSLGKGGEAPADSIGRYYCFKFIVFIILCMLLTAASALLSGLAHSLGL